MTLNPSYLLAALLLSLVPIAHAKPSIEDKKLTLSAFFKPINQDKIRFSISPLSYIFSGTTADTINTIRLCNATDATCGTCNTSFTIITAGTPIPYSTGGTQYAVSAASVAAYLASQSFADGSYNIGMYVQSSTANCSGSYCSTNTAYSLTPPNNPSSLLCMQATYSGGAVTTLSQSDNGNAVLNTAAPATQLSATVNTLALATSGTPRTLTITNVGTTPASSVAYTPSPALPAGTSIAPASCGSIVASGTCVLTITPGGTASAAAYDTSPAPITLTIAGSNTNTLNPTANILTYASVYQGGYLFSIDDTTAATGSIGGKTAALTDQAPASPNGIVWSSNGTSSTAVSYDFIPGIDQTSTTLSPSPALTPPPPTFYGCNGVTDGACDSKNMVTYYNYYRTGGGPPPTPLSDYSAGVCSSYTIDSAGNVPCVAGNVCYTGWFLPSICEMGPDSGYSICNTSSVEPNIVDNLPSVLGDGTAGGACTAGAGCLSGLYWSSTASSVDQFSAWYENFASASSGGSSQTPDDKVFTLGARCARALTL